MSFLSFLSPWSSSPTIAELGKDLQFLLDDKRKMPDEISEVVKSIWPLYHKSSTLDTAQFNTLFTNIRQLKVDPTKDSVEAIRQITHLLKFEEEMVSGDETEGEESWMLLTSADEIVEEVIENLVDKVEKRVAKEEAQKIVGEIFKDVVSIAVAKATKKSEPLREIVASPKSHSDTAAIFHNVKPALDPKMVKSYIDSLFTDKDLINEFLPSSYVDDLLKDKTLNLTEKRIINKFGKTFAIPMQFWADCDRMSVRIHNKLIYDNNNIIDRLLLLLVKPLKELITEKFLESFDNVKQALNLMKLVNQATVSKLAVILIKKYYSYDLNLHVVYDKIFNINIREVSSPFKKEESELNWIKIRYDNFFTIQFPDVVFYYLWGTLEITISKKDLEKGTIQKDNAVVKVKQSPLFKTREEAEKYYASQT